MGIEDFKVEAMAELDAVVSSHMRLKKKGVKPLSDIGLLTVIDTVENVLPTDGHLPATRYKKVSRVMTHLADPNLYDGDLGYFEACPDEIVGNPLKADTPDIQTGYRLDELSRTGLVNNSNSHVIDNGSILTDRARALLDAESE